MDHTCFPREVPLGSHLCAPHTELHQTVKKQDTMEGPGVCSLVNINSLAPQVLNK